MQKPSLPIPEFRAITNPTNVSLVVIKIPQLWKERVYFDSQFKGDRSAMVGEAW